MKREDFHRIAGEIIRSEALCPVISPYVALQRQVGERAAARFEALHGEDSGHEHISARQIILASAEMYLG